VGATRPCLVRACLTHFCLPPPLCFQFQALQPAEATRASSRKRKKSRWLRGSDDEASEDEESAETGAAEGNAAEVVAAAVAPLALPAAVPRARTLLPESTSTHAIAAPFTLRSIGCVRWLASWLLSALWVRVSPRLTWSCVALCVQGHHLGDWLNQAGLIRSPLLVIQGLPIPSRLSSRLPRSEAPLRAAIHNAHSGRPERSRLPRGG